jgi:osmotically-inducible protein OsmY
MPKTKSVATALMVASLALPLHHAGASPAIRPNSGSCADADGPTEADDTAKNVRDRNDATLTPLDQGGSEGDMRITTEIRKALVDDDALSTNAKNVKVITVDSVVTLRGPVETAQERVAIAAIAQKTPGVTRVDNQLEVDAD